MMTYLVNYCCLLVLSLQLVPVATVEAYEIVEQPDSNYLRTMDTNSNDKSNKNESCYCSPENTTVACNDTDVEPVQESSLIPDNAQYLYIDSNRISYDHIGQGNFTRTLNITEIIFKNCGVTEILPASFKALKSLKHFELSENQRPVYVRGDAFQGADMESVFLHKLPGGLNLERDSFKDAFIRTLVLVMCRLDQVPFLGHDSLTTSLTTLYLSQNNIREVRGWSFTGLEQLRRIYLDSNLIGDVLPHSFAGTELELVDLSHNRGINLHRSSFLGANIRKLKLSHCKLTKIDGTIFFPLVDYLTELDLSGNGLFQIDSSSFIGLVNLRILDLSNNSNLQIKQKSFSFTPYLEKLDLSECPNLSLEKGTFCSSSVEEFYIRGSTGILDFTNPNQLLPIVAGYRDSGDVKMQVLDASDCGIVSLARSQFWKVAVAKVGEEIRLHGNPLSCSDPKTAVMVSRFKTKLADICPDLHKYSLLMPQMHSELSYDEKLLEQALDDECRQVFANDKFSETSIGVSIGFEQTSVDEETISNKQQSELNGRQQSSATTIGNSFFSPLLFILSISLSSTLGLFPTMSVSSMFSYLSLLLVL